MKIKTKYASTAIITVLVLSSFISYLQASYAISQESQKPTENSSLLAQTHTKSLEIEKHKITSIELGKLKSQVGVHQEGQNYNQIVYGRGTGLSPPTQKEWIEISQNAYIIDNINYGSSPNSVDLSTTPWFPPIGNQANQGSCVAWSVGYYIKTYQEAKEHAWDLSGAKWEGGYSGYPTYSYQGRIISPAFVYNLINDGQDGGSSFHDAIQLACFIGVSSWSKMPYNRSDYTTWPSEAAWIEAPNYRGNSSGYQYININTDSGIDNLKNLIASQNLATISVDANQFSNLTISDLWTLDNYNNPVTNHAATIVGYDDNLNYMEAGQVRYGAFKIANSWGVGFTGEKISDGYYWISYEAMKQRISQGGPVMFYFDSINYQPSLLAKFNINHSKRSECLTTIGLGTPTAQIRTKNFNNYVSGGSIPFCTNNIVLDITEFKGQIPSLYNQPFFMKVSDGGTANVGTITYFAIDNINASGTPCQTKQNQDVYLNLTYSLVSPTLTVSPASGPASGLITLNGLGFLGNSVNVSYLNPATSIWIPVVNNLTTTSGNFTYTMNAPDTLQNNPTGDNPPLYDRVFFCAQDNGNGRSYNTTVPYTEWRKGLTQIADTIANGLYGNNTNLSTTTFVKNGQTIPIAGQWFSPGSVTLQWDNIKDLGTFSTDENGFFNTTVTVPTTPAGQHILTINCGTDAFCVTLTRLPKIIDDYVDEWYKSNITINLTPDYVMNEIFYKINNEPVINVTFNGQPTITTESSNNTIEYWSTWNLYGIGIIELPHVKLTGIKIDKTAPTGTITPSSNSVETPMITLSLNATDNLSEIVIMRFSNENSDWTNWETYSTLKNWTLQPGYGTKIINVQYMDNAGLISTYSCTVTLVTPITSPIPSPLTTIKPAATASPSTTISPTPSTSPMVQPSEIPQAPELNVQIFLILIVSSTIASALTFRRKRK